MPSLFTECVRGSLASTVALAALFANSYVFAADSLEKRSDSRQVDVITVTDMTTVGRKIPLPAKDKPVYYMMIDLGQQVIVSDMSHSGSWAGETLPDRAAARDAAIAALAEQGYRPGDLEKHVPMLLVFFSWGMVQGGDSVTRNPDGSIGNPTRPALQFLGGDKVDLMWDRERISTVDARMLTRGFERMGVKGKILDFSESNLFLGRIEAYTIDSLKAKKRTLLWETRFACLADGWAMADALPLMIKTAAPNFGRETKIPLNRKASRAPNSSVEIGETEFLGSVPGEETKPGAK